MNTAYGSVPDLTACRYVALVLTNQINTRPDTKTAVELTSRAHRALDASSTPLLVDIEVTFGCVITKNVSFRQGWEEGAVTINDRLSLVVRSLHYEPGPSGPTLVEFLPADAEALLPRTLHLDYRKGEWSGWFSYC